MYFSICGHNSCVGERVTFVSSAHALAVILTLTRRRDKFVYLYHKLSVSQRLKYITQEYDVFLTHDWGKDQHGRKNHDRVVEVAKLLTVCAVRPCPLHEVLVHDVACFVSDGIAVLILKWHVL